MPLWSRKLVVRSVDESERQGGTEIIKIGYYYQVK